MLMQVLQYTTYAIALLVFGWAWGRRDIVGEYEKGRRDGKDEQKLLQRIEVEGYKRRLANAERDYLSIFEELKFLRERYSLSKNSVLSETIREVPGGKPTSRVRHEYIRPTSYPNARRDDDHLPGAVALGAGMALIGLAGGDRTDSGGSCNTDSGGGGYCGGGGVGD